MKNIAKHIEYLSMVVLAMWLSGTVSAVAYVGVLVGTFTHKPLLSVLLFSSGFLFCLFSFFKKTKHRRESFRFTLGLAGLANLISAGAVQITASWMQQVLLISALVWFVAMLSGFGISLWNKWYGPLGESESGKL